MNGKNYSYIGRNNPDRVYVYNNAKGFVTMVRLKPKDKPPGWGNLVAIFRIIKYKR